MPRCECGSKNLFQDMVRGELVCNECGLVLQEDLPVSDAHYVRFTTSDHNAEMSFSTGNPVNALKVKSHRERRLEAIYHELKHKQVAQDVKDRALWVMKKYLRTKGRLPIHSLEDFVDSVVYLISREYGSPYVPRASMKNVAKVKKCLTLAGVAVWSTNTMPEHYLNKIIPEMGLGPEVKRQAAEIMDNLNRFTPATRAAVSVVMALEEDGREVALDKVAESAGISTSTLWKARKRLAGETSTKRIKKDGRGDSVPKGGFGYYFLERLNRSLSFSRAMNKESHQKELNVKPRA